MKTLLERNALPAEGLTLSENTLSAHIFFLRRPFIEHYFPMAGLASERLPEMVAFAEKIDQDGQLRLLAWHLHRWYVENDAFAPLPDHIDLLGAETGKLHLLLALSLIPFFEARAEREGFPLRYAQAAADRIGSVVGQRAQAFPGEYGLRGRSLPFLLHFRHSPAYRIGRFDFIVKHPYASHPELFRRGGEVVALCRENWKIGTDGLRLADDAPDGVPTRLVIDGDFITGTLIDAVSGRALPETATLDLRRYERLTGPESFIAEIHIPGGGGMSEELCRSSFREAKEFFSTYYANRKISAFVSISWIFSPDWPEYLPESNLSRLIGRTSHFPSPYNPKNGLFFVFGREDDNYAAYPRDNSMRRGMLRCLEEKGRLRGGGMFLTMDRIEQF